MESRLTRGRDRTKNVCPFQKERPFLRKQQRKPRKVGPARIDFRLRKSVFTVSDASTFPPSRCVVSRLGWKSPSTAAPGLGIPRPDVSAGRTVKPRPTENSGRFVSRPARLVCVTYTAAPETPSDRSRAGRWYLRSTFKCHDYRPGLNASVSTGILISTLQPAQVPSPSPPPRCRPSPMTRTRCRD